MGEARGGPLAGLRVIEMDCPGPCQFAAMLLADLGASVMRIGRPRQQAAVEWLSPPFDFMSRGRPLVRVDLRAPAGIDLILQLCRGADALLEGFRPGTMERLGLGPEACRGCNSALIYGRATGWGQQGPLAPTAGHDVNFLALSGALYCMREAGRRPVAPLNLLGDFGSGGMLLAIGVLGALFERQRSGQGQIVDAAMIDGLLLMLTMLHGFKAAGHWRQAPGHNLLDGGAPMYNIYDTADEEHLAVGALEPRFYREFLGRIGLDAAAAEQDYEQANWSAARARIAAAVRGKTRAQWAEVFATGDACATPVLSLEESIHHPQQLARQAFVRVADQLQPAPAPRFERTPADIPCAADALPGAQALASFGISQKTADQLSALGVLSA